MHKKPRNLGLIVFSKADFYLFILLNTASYHCPHSGKQLCCQQKQFLHLIASICTETLAVCLTYRCQMQTLLLDCYSTCSKISLEVSPIIYLCIIKKKRFAAHRYKVKMGKKKCKSIFCFVLVSIFFQFAVFHLL